MYFLNLLFILLRDKCCFLVFFFLLLLSIIYVDVLRKFDIIGLNLIYNNFNLFIILWYFLFVNILLF